MEQNENSIEAIRKVYEVSLVPGWHVVRAFESETDAKEYAKLFADLTEAKRMWSLMWEAFLQKRSVVDPFPGLFPHTERQAQIYRELVRKYTLIRQDLRAQIGEVPYGIPKEAEFEWFLGVWFVAAPYPTEEFEQIL